MTPMLNRLHRDERGMSLVFVAMGFMSFLAAATLAIDVGMFMTARAQAQTVRRRSRTRRGGRTREGRFRQSLEQRPGGSERARGGPPERGHAPFGGCCSF